VTQDTTDQPSGPLPGGDPDDAAELSTPGSDGDGPEAGYTPPARTGRHVREPGTGER